MADSLAPSTLHRLSAALRPDWTRTVAARRVAAAVLVLLAGITALRANPRGEYLEITVATHDLSPGIELTADDVQLHRQLKATLPEGAQSDLPSVIGATLAGPVRRGEILTDVRLLGPRLAAATAGPDARIVPLHLTDNALLDMIRPGDVVDVIAVDSEQRDGRAQLLAADAVVVLVSDKAKGVGTGTDRVALVALPAKAASDVAGAGLTQSVTVVMH